MISYSNFTIFYKGLQQSKFEKLLQNMCLENSDALHDEVINTCFHGNFKPIQQNTSFATKD